MFTEHAHSISTKTVLFNTVSSPLPSRSSTWEVYVPCSRALWQSVLNVFIHSSIFFFPPDLGILARGLDLSDPDSDTAVAIEASTATDHSQTRTAGVQWNEGDAALEMR